MGIAMDKHLFGTFQSSVFLFSCNLPDHVTLWVERVALLCIHAINLVLEHTHTYTRSLLSLSTVTVL